MSRPSRPLALVFAAFTMAGCALQSPPKPDEIRAQALPHLDVPAAWNQVINIGADTPYSVNQLVGVVGEAFVVEPKVTHLPPRIEVVHAYSSHEKARRIFGDSSPVTLADGIERMAEWARRVGARESSTFGSIEVERNLPPSWRARVAAE